MTSKKEIREIIFAVINEIKDEMKGPVESQINDDTMLIGSKGIFDSLGLVNLIVFIEQKIEDKFEMMITLADEEALSQKNSPFRTIGSLVDYVYLLLKNTIE